MQETDDNEPQLEDTTDPAAVVPQSSDPLPGERDVPVNICVKVKVFLCRTQYERRILG